MEQLLAQMQRDGRLAKSLSKKIQEYTKLAEGELSNTYRLEKALTPIQRLLFNLSECEHKRKLTEWYAGQQERIRTLKDEFRFKFGNELKEVLEREGFALSGQFPILRSGFYTIKLDFGMGFAAIFWGPEIEKVRGRAALNAQEITKAIVAFDRHLKGRHVEPAAFLKMLFEAYERHIGSRNIVAGSRVFLIDLLRELAFMTQPKKFVVNPTKENFQDYSRIDYSYDLYRLKQSEHTAIGGRQMRLSVATFDSTTERARSLWVPSNDQGEGTFYSYIAFVSESNQGPGPDPRSPTPDSHHPAPDTQHAAPDTLFEARNRD